MPCNAITDVPGLLVGNADEAGLASGVTAVIFEQPTVASIAIHGGAPGVRDTAILEPHSSIDLIDAIVFSGGSTYGLDACGGVQAWLRELGYGQHFAAAKVPLAPQAVLFDLANGGNKDWGRHSPYLELGFAAASAARTGAFALGTAGAGFGATTVNLKGGLGTASSVTPAGYVVGAIVAVNAMGSATMGEGPHFWAAPWEVGGEFGGLGLPARVDEAALKVRLKGQRQPSTTIALVATDAVLNKSEAKRVAIMAHDGMARALRVAHAPFDGDIVFAAATCRKRLTRRMDDLAEIGACAADCLARAIARGVFEASALPFEGSLPAWKDKFAGQAR